MDMLLYADDLEVMGAGREGRRAAVLAFAVMAVFRAPFKWGKQRGGLVTLASRWTTPDMLWVCQGGELLGQSSG